MFGKKVKEEKPEAQVEDHNKLVRVEVLGPLEYDGNPDVEGSEFYTPKSVEDGNPHSFSCPLITAEGLEKAGIVKILKGIKA
jgi:hypothetical protein